MSHEIEIEILRQRLKEYIGLLEVSHSLIFNPHDDDKKRKEQLDLYRKKLKENGIIDERNSD